MRVFGTTLQRGLLAAFAATVCIVYMAETSTEVHHVSPIVPGIDRFDGTLTTLAAAVEPVRYSDLIALAEDFPGSRILEATVRAEHRWNRSVMVAVGRVVEIAPLASELVLGSERPGSIELSGRSRRGDWRIIASQPGPREFVQVSLGDTGYLYIDSTLIRHELVRSDAIVVSSIRDGYDWVTSAAGEWALYVLLMLVGLSLMGDSGPQGRVRPWVGLVVGAAGLAATGVLLPQGGFGLVALCGVAALLVGTRAATDGVHAVRRIVRSRGGRIEDLVLAVVMLGLVPFAVRRFSLVYVTPDSFEYLGIAESLGLRYFTPDMFDPSFYIGQQAIHSAGYALGIGPLFSFGWVLLACNLAALAHLANRSWLSVIARDRPVMAALVTGVAAGTPYVWRFAAYVNAHMFVPALILAVILLLGNPTRSRSREFGLALVLFSAFTFMRGEAPLVIALLLLGLSRYDGDRGSTRYASLWIALAIPSVAWVLRVLRSSVVVGEGIPRSALIGTGLGVAFAIVGFVAQDPVLARQLQRLWVAPWLVLLASLLLFRGRLAQPLLSVRDNLLNLGADGGLLPLLMVGFAIVIAADPAWRRRPESAGLRTLVLGYLPTVFVARLMAPTAWSGGRIFDLDLDFVARVGFTDSTNRVLFHLWFVVLAAFLLGDGRVEHPRSAAGRLRVIALAAALGLIAQQWLAAVLPMHPYRWLGWAVLSLLGAVVVGRSYTDQNPAEASTSDPARGAAEVSVASDGGSR
jgi:hypothetical protein